MMKKIALVFVLFATFANVGFCSLKSDEINIYNLKKSNMYLLDLDTRVQEIIVSDKNIVDVYPVTSAESENKQLFVEANANGVCDVNIKTAKKDYMVRFIAGSVFEDTKKNLTKIDLPIGQK